MSDQYELFGNEWWNEVKKCRKDVIIEWYRDSRLKIVDLEQRIRELENVINKWTEWEAKVIKDDNYWRHDLPHIDQDLYEEYLAIQELRYNLIIQSDE